MSRRKPHIYTNEEILWLQNNHRVYETLDLVTEKFNEQFSADVDKLSIRMYCNRRLNIKFSNYFPWTQEQRDWVRDNFDINESIESLTNRFNDRFGVNASKDKIYNYVHGVLKLKRFDRHVYTQEENDWIKLNYCEYSGKDLVEVFNKRFGVSVTEKALKAQGQKLGVQNRVRFYKYTNEQIEWILANYSINVDRYKHKQTSEFPLTATLVQFNEHFSTDITYHSFFHLCKKVLGLSCGEQGFAIGEERKDGNYIKVKVSNGNAQHNYRYKHYIEWEKYHNMPIPEGKTVVFLNGDYSDFSESNLYCVDSWVSHAFARYERHDIETGLAILAYIMLGKDIKNKKRELKEGRV